MKSIRKFDLTRLRIEEDFGFQKRIESETALLTVETDKPMVDSYKAALNAFDDALKGSSRNPYSSAVAQADQLTDAAWSGLNGQVKAMLGHPIEASRAVAADAFRALTERVNALALVNGEDAYAAFIDRVNVIIDQASAVLAGRSTRAEKKNG